MPDTFKKTAPPLPPINQHFANHFEIFSVLQTYHSNNFSIPIKFQGFGLTGESVDCFINLVSETAFF